MAVRDPAPPGSRQREREDGSWVLVVPAEHWVSEAETCRLLRVGRVRLLNAVSADRVMKVENAAREVGYLRSSVEREAAWRARQPLWRRLCRDIWDNGF